MIEIKVEFLSLLPFQQELELTHPKLIEQKR